MNDPRPTADGCDRAAKILLLLGTMALFIVVWALLHG
jgi:hypothetical protein